LAGEEAHKEADSEGHMYRAALLEKTAELKEAYYEWFSIRKDIEITGKSRDLMERFEKISRARYSVGKGIQQDVLKAQVERSTLEQQLEVLEQRRASIEARIEAMLNRPPGQPLGCPTEVQRSEFSLDLNSLMDLVKQNAPRLRARQSEVDARAVGIERARREYRPDFNLSFQWQKTAAMFPDYYMATAEVKLPVFFWRKQRFGAEEAAARLSESRENYQATQQELILATKDQYFKIRSSERLLDLYRSGILPQASLALESAVASYEVGAVDFLTLLNSQATVLTYEMQYYEELAKHEQALARLEPLVARELTKP
jgi:outer membrane protein TolC